jgi:Zinc knuckle
MGRTLLDECYNCKQTGHIALDCPNFKPYQQRRGTPSGRSHDGQVSLLDANMGQNSLGNVSAQSQDFEQENRQMIYRQGQHCAYEGYVTNLFWFRDHMGYPGRGTILTVKNQF